MHDGQFFIPGPAGAIEACLENTGSTDIAVLCHPHPLYGGSMDDPVLATVTDALAAAGIGALRFNFRGVGASQGSHDGGAGERDDLAAVLDWLRVHRPEAGLLLGGYSFGAAIISRFLEESPVEIERAILIAPPVGNLPTTPPDGRTPVDVVAGDADPFLDLRALRAWTAASMHVISGADHFFSGHRGELGQRISRILDAPPLQ